MRILFYLLIFMVSAVRAEIVDTYRFKSVEDRNRAVALAKSLRCPQCQNQNLVESNSPIAYDLRLEVYKMIDEGKSNEQIVDVMTSRFGNFVLYKPPFQRTTALLWGLPVLLLLTALYALWRYSRQRANIPPKSTALSPEQKRTLTDLLEKK
ncbi:heme lyase NrfEFG subunit NrfF [Actinobacillus succinogenes]|uniref:Formate-dependent nitrite reductase complex subunit n=1 Tax=Actinobacillus succinogenes (strain ATCC 55618 / DSM 22257 / CCUG 43843 / 130Z) TaxID=339671 RepID=A6VM86_ACTSZ|nr:heme lyase NrfEFG subunit NrfF [Actinobacillus succinogenes]ABR74083.1 cytochrome C biogenesis protein [Actinobacillus succinogenes 130Z]PHI39483.1 heme lyase NrfEFG subunit NrfF [Actinobacillus succinogenes]